MHRHSGSTRLLRFALLIVIAVLAGLIALLSIATAHAQTSPAHGPITAEGDMPMSDFLALLEQLAPAAAAGAKVYLGAVRLQCGRMPSTAELRHALAREGGDPVLMGLIRASQQQDLAARNQLVRQIRCPAGGAR
ncbi:hypothetical protein [Ottowia sp.]|uniref:hypothetical protein n=1 Tax=Ottowia sp. TaxID=1898956 RepID=UPI0026290D7B|nr:hypothetical protein [Ottowia sp.]